MNEASKFAAIPGVYSSLEQLVALRYRASGFTLLPRQPVHSALAGRHASRLRGRGLNFEEIRGYLPGDDPRTIDWKVSARTRKMHTRVFTEERERPVLLVVDQRMSMFFGSRTKLKSVAATEAAAIAAWRTLAVQDRIGAIVFADAGMDVIRPHRSAANVLAILQSLVKHNHALHAQAPPVRLDRFNEALQKAAMVAKHDHLVVVISDGQGIDETSRQWATEIAQHNDVLVGFIYDPLEADFNPAGRAVVSDGELQLELPGPSQELRQRFRADFDSRLQTARQFLLTRQTPLLSLNAAEDIAWQIAKQLGAAPGKQQ